MPETPFSGEPQVYICHVAYVNEVAFEVLATFEQLRRFTVIKLGVEMESDARHTAFMAFTRSINVEIAEANNLRVRFWQDLTNIFIKQEF